jgi:hypothetical protein
VATLPSAHVAARLSDPDRARARARLLRHSLLDLLPRLCGQCSVHRYAAGAAALVDLLDDSRLVLAGPSAARALNWTLSEGTWPVEAYVPEPALVEVAERYELEPDLDGDVVLRSMARAVAISAPAACGAQAGGHRRPGRRYGH